MTSDERRSWGRIGGLTAWAMNGPDVMVGPANAGFRRKFERQVDPAGVLPEAERAVRVERARRAYMLQLAAKSAAARKKRPGPDCDSGRAMTGGRDAARPPSA